MKDSVRTDRVLGILKVIILLGCAFVFLCIVTGGRFMKCCLLLLVACVFWQCGDSVTVYDGVDVDSVCVEYDDTIVVHDPIHDTLWITQAEIPPYNMQLAGRLHASGDTLRLDVPAHIWHDSLHIYVRSAAGGAVVDYNDEIFCPTE